MLDEWYEDEDGKILYDENITSQEDLEKQGIKGNYLGKTGISVNKETGELIYHGENGETTNGIFQLSEVGVESYSTETTTNLIIGAFGMTRGRMQDVFSLGTDIGKSSERYLTGSRVIGKTLGFASVGLAINKFANSPQNNSDYARLGGSAIIYVSSYIPWVGPFISMGLGIADSKGSFNSVYNWFDK